MSELMPMPIPLPASDSSELEKSISSFHPRIADYLSSIGLPTENILSSYADRIKVISALSGALEIIPLEERDRATYLSKFTVAISVGLFDGALIYLWDETISALRRLATGFDLEYFFSIAEKVSSRNRNFSSIEDLDHMDDHDLLETCRRVGLINEVNYKRLDHINYMRNHASAAHPNVNEIDGYEMVAFLSNCLRYAIKAEPDQAVITISRLLTNMRNEKIPPTDFPVIGVEVAKLPQERIDDLLWALFGIYTDEKQASDVKANINGIARDVWKCSSVERRYEIGSKFGVFRKNGDVPRKDAAQEFLKIVDGEGYKDEDSLAWELIEKLDILKSVHFGYNNFYNEYPHAIALGNSLLADGTIPRAARSMWVKVITMCYVGNGLGYKNGVDEGALPSYKGYIENFSEDEIIEFLILFSDVELTSAFNRTLVDSRVRSLTKFLKTKTENLHILRLLDLILKAPEGTLDNLHSTTEYKDAIKHIPSIR